MIVELLARTQLVEDTAGDMGWTYPVDLSSDADYLAEVAGRECYQSWERPSPKTATNYGYLANIIDHQHFSVLEHASLTFSIRHVSRALSHELVRHRHLSFSQQSQRYVDESAGNMMFPPELSLLSDNAISSQLTAVMIQHHMSAESTYKAIVDLLTQAGAPRKRARQAARYVLPSGHWTRLVVSGNIRAWREVVTKRAATSETGVPHADLEFFHLAQWLIFHLHGEAPNSIADLWNQYLDWLPTGDQRLVIEPMKLQPGEGPEKYDKLRGWSA